MMRYRRRDANGDYMFGHGDADFYIDQPEAVAQAVQTRLQLWLGDWWIDTSDGTPWRPSVLGKYTEPTRDPALKSRILQTPNLTNITSYSNTFDNNTRKFTVQVSITTAFSVLPIDVGNVTHV